QIERLLRLAEPNETPTKANGCADLEWIRVRVVSHEMRQRLPEHVRRLTEFAAFSESAPELDFYRERVAVAFTRNAPVHRQHATKDRCGGIWPSPHSKKRSQLVQVVSNVGVLRAERRLVDRQRRPDQRLGL